MINPLEVVLMVRAEDNLEEEIATKARRVSLNTDSRALDPKYRLKSSR
jgi:hypothetical protein